MPCRSPSSTTQDRLLGVVPRVTLLAALGNVTPTPASSPVRAAADDDPGGGRSRPTLDSTPDGGPERAAAIVDAAVIEGGASD